MKKSDRFIVLLSIPICIWIFWSYYQDNLKNDQLKMLNKTTIGQVERVTNRNVYFTYQMGDEFLNGETSRPFMDVYQGEVFKVYFDDENSDEVLFDFYSPIYRKENFIQLETSEYKIITDGGIIMYYSYEEMKYERNIRLSEAQISSFDSTSLKILVNKENPHISYPLSIAELYSDKNKE